MHFLSSLVLGALAAIPPVTSVAVHLEKRDSDISVTLSSVEHAVVKAVVKNNAAEALNLLKAGSFLDAAPVYKATVFKDGVALPFNGLLLRTKSTNLTADAFTGLAPGATVESTFDLAAVTDLKAGGTFEVIAEGVFAVAAADSTSLSASKVPYRSNTLSITVDGAYAAKVAPAIHLLDDRTVERSCSGTQQTALTNALSRAVQLSNAAANAATSGSSSKFNEYFKTTTTTARNTVAARFQGVATQAGSINTGSTTYYCNDPYGYCDPNVLAYTLPSQNLIANCPVYYSGLPLLTGTCHAQDQVTTSIHEFTHAPATYSPGTADNAYGYAASTALSSSQAILNADSYALYANAIYVGC